MTHHEISRRKFIATSVAAGGGMVVGFSIPTVAQSAAVNMNPWESPTDKDGEEINAWLTVDRDGTVTIRVGQAEMGQGVFTSMPMIVAEELQVDWKMVVAEYADGNRHVRNDNVYQRMSTGGSGAVRRSRVYLQQAGASARERLKEAAAQAWGVARSTVTAKDSVLSSGNNTGTYAEFAAAAAGITFTEEEEPAIKTPDQFTLLGTSVARLDTPLKVDGSATFGIDVRVPGMLYAAIEHSPTPGGLLKSMDADAVRGLPGVVDVLRLGEGGIGNLTHNLDEVPNRVTGITSSVVVVADTYYHALSALNQMPKSWDARAGGGTTNQSIEADALAILHNPAHEAHLPVQDEGDAAGGIAGAATVVESTYTTPFLEHACMEPMNCTVHVTADRVDVWGGFQNAPGALGIVADELGVEQETVFTHQTFLGDGFGLRSRNHEVREAAAIAKAIGKPVKLLWSREETTSQGKYRPYATYYFKGGLDSNGKLVGYENRIISQSIFFHQIPQYMRDGLDSVALEGMDARMPYTMPNKKVTWGMHNTHIPPQWFRSVGMSQNPFALESYIDELAYAAGADPLQFRLDMLPEDSEFLAPYKVVAEKAGWDSNLPKGQGMGIAASEGFGSIIATVAKVTVSRRGQLTIDSIDVAVDCGHIINGDTVAAQIDSCQVTGLSSALFNEMTIVDGAMVEKNFDTYLQLKISQMPQVNTHLALSGGEKWGGIGEPATGPILAALPNAIFAATGVRIRSLPIRNHNLSWS
jgi:isoquinoline 1-oxidoreductase beta subunit